MDGPEPNSPVIDFRALGTVQLTGPEGNPLLSVLKRPKLLALLTYLAANARGGFVRRDTLIGLFWAEFDLDRARNALRQSLHHLRRSLGDDVLLGRGDDEIGLAADRFGFDVAAFEEAHTAGRHQEAQVLYRGDLLEGFFVADAPEFERWLDERRAELRRKATSAAWALAEEAESALDASAARAWAVRALELAPLDEDLVRRVIALLDRLGDRSAAVQVYEAFADRLSAELELEPAPETQAQIESVRARTMSNGRFMSHAAIEDVSSVGEHDSAATGRLERRRWGFRLGLIAGAAIVLGILVIGSFHLVGKSGEGLEARRVLVTVFDNQTGDSSLDPVGLMAADWITQGIRRTGLLEAVPPEATVALSSARSESRQALRTLAESTGAGTVITGTIYLLDDSVQIQAHVTDVTSQTILVSVESDRAAQHDPGPALESLRQRVVGALAITHDYRIASFASVTLHPPKFEAYRAFAEGEELYNRSFAPGNSYLREDALVLLLRAFELDTTLRAAQLRAGMAMLMLGRPAQADSITHIVAEYRDELSPFARAEFDMLAADLAGDRLRALEAARRRFGTPLDPAMRAIAANHPAEAVEILENAESYSERIRSYGLYGIDEIFWLTLADAYHMLGNYKASLRVAKEGRAHYPAMLSLLAKQVAALAALGRVDAVNDLLDESLTLPRQQGWPQPTIVRVAALELRAHGHKEASLGVAQRVVNWYRSLPAGERAAPGVRFDLGMAYMLTERWDQAQPLFEALVAEEPDDVDYQGVAGVLAAAWGDREEAVRRSESLVGLADPYDHGRQQYWQACITAQMDDIERAMVLLRDSYARGRAFDVGLHVDLFLEPLHQSRLFQELLAPKG